MSMLAAAAFGWRWMRGTAGSAFHFVADHPWQAACLGLAIWLAWLQLVTLPARDAAIAAGKATIELRTTERDDERTAHQSTKQGYRAAQAEAVRIEAQRIERVRVKQQEISDDIAQTYRTRLAGARADAERLRVERERARAGAGAGSSSGGEPVSGISDASAGSDGTTTDHRLPAADVDIEWRLVATEQAIQLDELISWIEAQGVINPNSVDPAQAD